MILRKNHCLKEKGPRSIRNSSKDSRLKDAELKKMEQEILPEVKKIRVKKEKVEREKAIFIKDYQFQINDTVRLKEGNAKGTVEKIRKKYSDY